MTGIEKRIRYGKMVPVVLSVSDIAAMVVSYTLASFLIPYEQRILWLSMPVELLAIAAWIPAGWNLYRNSSYRAMKMERTAMDAIRALGFHALVFISLIYLSGINGPQWQTLAVFYALAIILLPIARTLTRTLLKAYRRHGKNYSRVVIVGNNETSKKLLYELENDPGFGYRVLAVFGDTPFNDGEYNVFTADISELEQFVKENKVDEIFCTLPGDNPSSLLTTVAVADNNKAQYYYVPQISRFVPRGFKIDTLGHLAVMPVTRSPLSVWTSRAAKRMMDLVISGTAILIFPLVFIPVAIAIKLSSGGPVFYRQKRTGYKGKPFDCLKFRTMYYNPDDEAPVEKNDPRVTPIGKILRHSSIDELPQIFNVFIGQMSIVGPRPHMVSHTEYYQPLIAKYMVRHSVKPGITGWAQVNGFRGSTDKLWKMEKRVEHDVWYIENWSFMLDAKIIARTLINIFKGDENAF
ncbi:MAG: undecaprenyl-phosphate glucose phosphotransferase [Paramuribaculum sp.]|nr:undecaprenyl-phosphate glucose phosphotransferase [Paramuribaculum sp.]